MPFKKSEVCNSALCYAAQSLYLCKGYVFTPLATASEATWCHRKGCERKEDRNASELNLLKISYWL